MADLTILPVEFRETDILHPVRSKIASILNWDVVIEFRNLNLDPWLNPDRDQYDAGMILRDFEQKSNGDMLAIVTSRDLFIPILTFVFGLSKLGGNVSIVSSCRLRSEFYGLPPDKDLLQERLLKESIHEIGHNLNLMHCRNYSCVMSMSSSVEELEIKGEGFCSSCYRAIMS